MQATSAAATDSNDDASTTPTPDSPKTVTVGQSLTDGQEPVTSGSPKTVTVGQSVVGGQQTSLANPVLGASQTSPKAGGATGTGSGIVSSKAGKEDLAIGMRTGIAMMVALITMFVF